MKTTNMYGFISGGYIYDLLDRSALDEINTEMYVAMISNEADRKIWEKILEDMKGEEK